MTPIERAETIRSWLLGRREPEERLKAYAARARWTRSEYARAFEVALRRELIEWDPQTDTWGASRAWTARSK